MIIFDLIDYPELCEYAESKYGEDGIDMLNAVLLEMESNAEQLQKYTKKHLYNYTKKSLRNKSNKPEHKPVIEEQIVEDNMDLIIDIRRKVSLLDTIYKDVIELIMQGYSRKDIANELGIELSTVYKREKKAKEILKERLSC